MPSRQTTRLLNRSVGDEMNAQPEQKSPSEAELLEETMS